MPAACTYKYDFFISYPHMGEAGQSHLITEFVEALESKLAFIQIHTDTVPTYRDVRRLQPGFRWEKALAQALCHSRCMLLVYSPAYFSCEYCALEFKAMQELEQKRVGRPINSMIIPIIVLAENGNKGLLLPEELRPFQYEDFRTILNPKRQFENIGTLKKLRKIADRLSEIRQSSPEPTQDCETYDVLGPVKLNPTPEESFGGTW